MTDVKHVTGWPMDKYLGNNVAPLCQLGVTDRGKEHALFVEFVLLKDEMNDVEVKKIVGSVPVWTEEIMNEFNVPVVSAIGIGNELWRRWDDSPPRELVSFTEIKQKNTENVLFPAPKHDDLFIFVKSDRIDVANVLVDKVISRLSKFGLLDFSKTIGFTHRPHQGYRIGLGRDLTGFIDGTRNAFFNLEIIIDSVAITALDDPTGTHQGGSYMYTSKFVHDLLKYETLNETQKNHIIGRDISSVIGPNIPENPRLPDYKNLSDPVVRRYHINNGFGAMYRQSMPFISGNESGLYFIAFSGSLSEMKDALFRMAGHNNDQGLHDALFDITRSTHNGFFYVPTLVELNQLANS